MSNNLNLDQLAATQVDKTTTVNDQSGQLDAAITESTNVEISTTSPLAISDAIHRRQLLLNLINAGSPPVANFTLQFSAIKRGLFLARNSTSFVATLEIASQPNTSPTLEAGRTGLFLNDSVNIQKISDVGATTNVLDNALRFSVPVVGQPTADERLFIAVIGETVTLPANMTNSVGKAKTAATAQTDFDLQKNGVSIGTIRFAAAGDTPTFVNVSETAFVSGDLLEVIGGASPDGTLADFAITIVMER